MSAGGIVVVVLGGLALFAVPVGAILWSWWWVFEDKDDER